MANIRLPNNAEIRIARQPDPIKIYTAARLALRSVDCDITIGGDGKVRVTGKAVRTRNYDLTSYYHGYVSTAFAFLDLIDDDWVWDTDRETYSFVVKSRSWHLLGVVQMPPRTEEDTHYERGIDS